MDNRLPPSAYKYFWEINPAELDVSAHPRYVIERLLEYGDFVELRWLLSHFDRAEIMDALKRSRTLSRRRAVFWASYFDLPRKEIQCLSRSSQEQHAAIWPY
jgi:hypothetical protein